MVPERPRIAFLDGWRALAILVVLVGHFGPRAMGFAGGYGVELFFVLSGRLMADILFERQQPLPEFFRRRMSRVYPALLFFVLATWAVSALAYPIAGVGPRAAATSLTFTMNYAVVFGFVPPGGFGHIWSLAVEEHCYALLALFAVFSARRRGWAIAICLFAAGFAMANGWRLWLAGESYWYEIYYRSDVRMAAVFLPAAIFLMSDLRGRASPFLPLACFAVSLFAFGPWMPEPVRYTVGTAALAIAVNTMDVAPEWARGLLSLSPLRWIGQVSYSAYLWQQPFYMAGAGALAVGPIFIIAWLSFKFIEQPSRKALNAVDLSAFRKRTAPASTT